VTLVRVAQYLLQDHDPDWQAWMQTWETRPTKAAIVEALVINDTLQCSWVNGESPVEVNWNERALLEALKTKTPAEIAGPLLWTLARIVGESGELDALIRQVAAKETGLVPEPVPFVRRGLVIASRMGAGLADKAKSSPLVSVTTDQHGTLIKLALTDPRIRALLDRFLRRYLWTV
jgi:hypothetical protein